MKRILSVLLSAAIAAASLAGCASGAQSSQAETSQPVSSAATEFTVKKIGVTYVKSPLNVPSIVEKEKGIFTKAFEEYGLTVEYSNLTAGPEQTQALASGDIQFLYAVGATSVILSASNGADIKIISTYSRSPEAFRIFAGKDSKIQSAADLKGKKIAGPKGTILHELMVAYLATAGLTEKDVEFVSMSIPDAQAALVGGTVDCALLAGPTAYNMAKDGYKIVTTGKGLVDATIVVATSQSFYDKNPLLVKRFLEAEDQIQSYMKENPEEILKITAKATELSIDAVKEMYPMYDFSSEITDADIASMKKTEQFMKKNAMIENDVDINQLILKVK
ncbi:ABC transporter substrate-binding protein [Faecalispora anaeroviscerum]|uniref:ABC transporter substrate-binding protein n=1 Tax=Faecalispora anaeroviscerum TaxID=2991836 RepID=UPI0024BA13DA|nr:NrtA/SsuA/CpmA family ABC transporter substrate-binding protein [Faecalispora anaeroviscerum]